MAPPPGELGVRVASTKLMMKYLFIYLGIGAFLAVAGLLHKEFDKGKAIVACIIMVLLWPLIVLCAPEIVFGSRRRDDIGIEQKKDSLRQKAAEYIDIETANISDEERQRIMRVAKYGYKEVCTFANTADFKDIIDKLWSVNLHPNLYSSYYRSQRYLDESYDPDREPRFSLKPPEWYIGFSNEFVRSIAKIDKKKQGRILEAISKITVSPIEMKGDTIKPLTGDLNGLWRCRIGDDRLIYFPDVEERKIVLIIFSNRGAVYSSMPDVSTLTSRL